MRDSMVFYRNFRDALSKLPEKERLEAYEAIFDYALDDKEPEDGIVGAFVQCFIPTIKKNNQRYENGKHGGRPRNQTETNTKPNETKTGCKSVRVKECKSVSMSECQNDSVKEGESDSTASPDGDGDKKRTSRFRPPSVEEVEAYCFERNNKVDPERFVDFYSSNGWKVGKNPMKDWKAAVRTWEKRDGPSNVVGLNAAQKMAAARDEVLDRIIGGVM